MRIDITVAGPDDLEIGVPVVIETEADILVAELSERLVDVVGHEPVSDLYVGARRVEQDMTLFDAQVESGVAIGLGAPVPQDTPPGSSVEVRVVGGPGAGSSFGLSPGRYRINGNNQSRIAPSPNPDEPGTQILVRVDRTVWVEDANDIALEWRDGEQRPVGLNLMEVSASAPAAAPLVRVEGELGRDFNRPPRFVPPPMGGRFRLPVLPQRSEVSPVPIATLLLTPVGAAMTGIFITGSWRFVFLAVLSPIAALITMFGSRRRGRQSYARQMQDHQATTSRVRSDIDAALLQEQRLRRRLHPDPAGLARIAIQPTDRLWERRITDGDFLELRVGTASVPSSVQVEDPELDEHRRTTVPVLEDVPVTVSLRAQGVVGVTGTDAASQAAWMVAQAAVLHAPRDLRIYVLTERSSDERWEWVRWLPHCRATDGNTYVQIGATAEALSRRVNEIGRVIAARVEAEADRRVEADRPDLLVVLDGARRLRSLPGVVSILSDGPRVGVHVLCVDSEERLLPEESRAVVTVNGPSASLRATDELSSQTVRPDHVGGAWYESVARALTPIRCASEDGDAVIPSSVRLLDVLDLEPPTGDAVRAGWTLRPRSTSALMGTGLDGPFSVDLVKDGPHALVAGTTGAGKSELLQTLVASLAVSNRPDELTFVLVDYKGGSAFAECEQLPHTVGMVTDLDTHLVERALVSLGAELRRREHLLADHGASDIAAYQELRRRSPELAPLPRLVLVVDEFASMVRELPDFVSGLVTIAQRGRSLGIHLVLATQRPSGAITPDIRANTNLRIALRTTDQAESRDIIDAPYAGELSPSTPGRAYARLGYAALLPFQTARIGGSRPDASASTTSRTRVFEVPWEELGDPPRRATPPKTPDSNLAPVTDLALLVEAVRTAAHDAGIVSIASPWLPALPDTLLLEDLEQTPHEPRDGAIIPVAVGMLDLPADQRQVPLTVNFESVGHLYVLGAGRSGRSQTLRTLAFALTSAHRTNDVHIYGIDCGNGALLPLTGLPHCGAVVDRTQTERLDRLLNWLNSEVSRRQAVFAQGGFADLTEQRATAGPDDRLPHVVVVLDRFEVFEREFSTFDNGRYLDRLVRLLRDGASTGVHLVMAGDKALGSGRFAGFTEDKLVLRMNDRNDYATVGLDRKSVPDNLPPGRALRKADGAEAQLALLDEDPSGAAQAARLVELAERASVRDADVAAGQRPRGFGVLPETVTYAEAAESVGAVPVGWALVGVGGDDLAPLGPDLSMTPTFLIGGPPRSGRSTALLTMARSLTGRGVGVVAVAPRRSPLRSLSGSGVAAVLEDPVVTKDSFRAALGHVDTKYGVVLIDDAELVLQGEIDADLLALVRGSAGPDWAVIAAGSADSLAVSLVGWVAHARRNRSGLLLSPQGLSDGELVGVRLTRGQLGGSPHPGRGYLHLGDGALTAVQVPE